MCIHVLTILVETSLIELPMLPALSVSLHACYIWDWITLQYTKMMTCRILCCVQLLLHYGIANCTQEYRMMDNCLDEGIPKDWPFSF